IAKLGREPGGGLIVAPDAFTIVHQHLFIRLAEQHRLPAVYHLRASVARGALMSYGPDPYDIFRRSASYVDRILKGAKPADLPVQEPRKFELATTRDRVSQTHTRCRLRVYCRCFAAGPE